MREMICKAKRKDNGEWIEGYYYKSWECKKGDKFDVHFVHNYELDDSYEIDPNTLCYLTHMTDVNEDKIWENDIVEPLSSNFVLQVVWSEEYHEFLFKNLEGGYDFMCGKISELSAFCKDKKIVVVGNVFDEEV